MKPLCDMGVKNSNFVYLYNVLVPVFYHDHRWNYGLMSKKKHYTEDASFFLNLPHRNEDLGQ